MEFKKRVPMADPEDFQRRWVALNPLQGYVQRAEARIGRLAGEPPPSMPPLDPATLPPGSKQIGTSGGRPGQPGRPVYQLPNGEQRW